MDYYLQNYFIYKNIPYLCTEEKIFQKYTHKMIKDFNFFAPTRIVFGKNAEMQIGDLVAQQNGHKVLVHYGGGSAERSGLLDVVREQLKNHGIPFVELGGVVPNPLLSKVQEGISLCRREQVDFILAVGGGSVIDSLLQAVRCRPAVSLPRTTDSSNAALTATSADADLPS